MDIEQLHRLCEEAARDLLRTHDRPVPPTVVLPHTDRTALVTLPALPSDDVGRHEVLAQLAHDRITADQVPCWGFVAEAEVDGHDHLVVVFGARRHAPQLTASRLTADGALEGFVAPEELDPTALPFLHPLQHAVDALPGVTDVLGSAGQGSHRP